MNNIMNSNSRVLKSELPLITLKYTKSSFKRQKVSYSGTAYEIIKQLFDRDSINLIEEFIVLFVNRANETIGYIKFSGGFNAALVDPRVIYSVALKSAASGIIIAHNHPSGRTSPSIQDKAITNKIKEGCKLLDLNFLDHLIVTEVDYYSFQN